MIGSFGMLEFCRCFGVVPLGLAVCMTYLTYRDLVLMAQLCAIRCQRFHDDFVHESRLMSFTGIEGRLHIVMFSWIELKLEVPSLGSVYPTCVLELMMKFLSFCFVAWLAQ